MKFLKPILKPILAVVVCLFAVQASALTNTIYSEFYCRSGGTNINSGHTTNVAAIYTTVNGNWSSSTALTNVFIPTDGVNPVTAGVLSNGFASVYLDGATNGVYIARVNYVTNAVNGGIILDNTAASGTMPSVGATGRSLKFGGAWKGPYGNLGFPITIVSAGLVDTNGYTTCVNFMNDAVYSITNNINQPGFAGPIRYEGFTTNPHDGGKATFQNNGITASYVLLTAASSFTEWVNLIFDGTGFTSGTSDGVTAGANQTWRGCVFHDIRGIGLNCGSAGGSIVACEAYLCNKSASSSKGGFQVTDNWKFYRTIAHDNTGANSIGIILIGKASVEDSILDSNAAAGIRVDSGANNLYFKNLSFYGNGSSALLFNASSSCAFNAENCVFANNTGWAIDTTGSTGKHIGTIENCAFGVGAGVTNSSGNVNIRTAGGTIMLANNTSFSSLPWTDAPNGNFKLLAGSALIGAGAGSFTQTQAAYTGTVSYPDINAAAATNTPAATGGSWTFIK